MRQPPPQRSPLPDAALLFADRFIAFDHAADEAHVVCLAAPAGTATAAEWADAVAARLRSVRAAAPRVPADPGGRTAFALRRDAEDYLRDVESCQAYLAAGESYEICLTNELAGPRCADALSLHRVLRRVNPAPFAAFLRLGGVEVASSSPGALSRTRPLRPPRGASDQGHGGPRR